MPVWKIEVSYPWKKTLRSYDLSEDLTKGLKSFDRTVGPVDTFVGGTRAALKRLKEFTETQLAEYDERRNHPEVRGTSQMSPYLHFGHIGPITIAMAVRDAVARGMAGQVQADKYLDEMIGWRELSVLFVQVQPELR